LLFLFLVLHAPCRDMTRSLGGSKAESNDGRCC